MKTAACLNQSLFGKVSNSQILLKMGVHIQTVGQAHYIFGVFKSKITKAKN